MRSSNIDDFILSAQGPDRSGFVASLIDAFYKGLEGGAAKKAAGEAMPGMEILLRQEFEGSIYCLVRVPARAEDVLTDVQKNILGLLLAGLTNQGIAEELGIRTTTVSNHVARIYGRLGVHSRVELMRCGALFARPASE